MCKNQDGNPTGKVLVVQTLQHKKLSKLSCFLLNEYINVKKTMPVESLGDIITLNVHVTFVHACIPVPDAANSGSCLIS